MVGQFDHLHNSGVLIQPDPRGRMVGTPEQRLLLWLGSLLHLCWLMDPPRQSSGWALPCIWSKCALFWFKASTPCPIVTCPCKEPLHLSCRLYLGTGRSYKVSPGPSFSRLNSPKSQPFFIEEMLQASDHLCHLLLHLFFSFQLYQYPPILYLLIQRRFITVQAKNSSS